MFPTELSKTYPNAIKFLTNAILKDKLANSYVFIAKDTTNSLLIALSLAKILNCEQNKKSISRSCGNCINCKWLEKNEHPQAFITIKPDSKNKKEQINIDDIRELLNSLTMTSNYFRILFFQNSSLRSLTSECCNLLLKTVEETPERTIFIFANTTRNDILPTILSRSQIIYLNKKYNSLLDTFNEHQTMIPQNEDFINYFSFSLKEKLTKAKETLDFLNKNQISLKNYLMDIGAVSYEKAKYSNQKQYCDFQENVNLAYSKHKSFIQTKNIIEDLFIKLTKR